MGGGQALLTTKDMFFRMYKSELMATIVYVVSTEKLRQRLQEEGLSEGVIQKSEQINNVEFAVMQKQLVLLKQKQKQFIDT